MTFGELYSDWLEEILESELVGVALPTWLTDGMPLAEIYKANDPIAYRCGFADWLQVDNLQGWNCEECVEEFTEHDINRAINDCTSDDDAVCCVCAGTRWRCDTCGETFDNDQEPANDGDDLMCSDCLMEE